MNTLVGSAPIMHPSSTPDWHHHTIYGVGEVAAVINHIVHHMAQADFSDKEQFAVRLSLEEAIVNAIKHGNKSDLSKSVKVDFQVTPEVTTIRLEDEGPGFNPDKIPDPLAPENLEQPGGRGVFLMRHYMSTVDFNPKGNAVTLTKRRGG